MCIERNITYVNEYKSNEFGLPFVRGLLESTRKIYKSQYYGYMNSDILLNPKVFSALQMINANIKNGRISDSVELISQVKSIHQVMTPKSITLREFDCFFQSVSKNGKLRHRLSAVVLSHKNNV